MIWLILQDGQLSHRRKGINKRVHWIKRIHDKYNQNLKGSLSGWMVQFSQTTVNFPIPGASNLYISFLSQNFQVHQSSWLYKIIKF